MFCSSGSGHNRSCVIQNEPHIWHRSLWHLTYLVSLTRPGALALASRGWVMSELWRLYQTQFTWNWRWKCISSGTRPTMVVMKILFFSQLAHQRLGLGQWEYFLPRRHLPSLLEIKNFYFFQETPILEVPAVTSFLAWDKKNYFSRKNTNFGFSSNLCNKCMEPIYLKISKDLQSTCNQYFRPGGRNCKSVPFDVFSSWGWGCCAPTCENNCIETLVDWSVKRFTEDFRKMDLLSSFLLSPLPVKMLKSLSALVNTAAPSSALSSALLRLWKSFLNPSYYES